MHGVPRTEPHQSIFALCFALHPSPVPRAHMRSRHLHPGLVTGNKLTLSSQTPPLSAKGSPSKVFSGHSDWANSLLCPLQAGGEMLWPWSTRGALHPPAPPASPGTKGEKAETPWQKASARLIEMFHPGKYFCQGNCFWFILKGLHFPVLFFNFLRLFYFFFRQ